MKLSLPTPVYGSNDKPMPNCWCSETNGPKGQYLMLWHSYKTLVAFKVDHNKMVVRDNCWGPTTGKHLNAIDGGDRNARVSETEFDRLLDEQLNGTAAIGVVRSTVTARSLCLT